MYMELDNHLAAASMAMGYHPNPITWKDQAPLMMLEQEEPAIVLTEWWQLKLGEMLGL